MKKVSVAFSALAVAATVSTAMAHTKTAAQTYCLAATETSPGVFVTIVTNTPTPGSISCETLVTRGVSINPSLTNFNRYGFLKADPTQPCPAGTCPRIKAVSEL